MKSAREVLIELYGEKTHYSQYETLSAMLEFATLLNDKWMKDVAEIIKSVPK